MGRKHSPLYHYMPLYTDFRDMMDRTVERYSDSVVYAYRHRPSDATPVTVTYSAFREVVRAVGTRLLDIGLGRTHIALIGRLSYPWICAFFGVLTIGAVVVPLDRDWSEEELAETMKKAECGAIFYTEDIRDKVLPTAEALGARAISLDGEAGETLEALRAEGEALLREGDDRFARQPIDPEALSELVFTSGTTGKGKGVMLSQKCVLRNLYGAFQILNISKRTVGTLPPHHTYGSTISILSSFCNGSYMYLSSGLKYFPRELVEQKPTYLILVPLYVESFYRRIQTAIEKSGREKQLNALLRVSRAFRKVGIDLRRILFGKTVLSAFGGKIRTIICGGAPLSQKIIDSFDDFGIRVLNGYGITECSPLICANRTTETVAGAVGYPLPNEDVKIDRPNEAGEGEVCVRGPHVMLGYFKDPEATAQAMDTDGFFHTGDIGKLKDGFLFLTGRMKNLIILSNGKNVYPEEIETALMTTPGISEIVVYEGISRRGHEYNTIVAEIYPDTEYFKRNGQTPDLSFFNPIVESYNSTAVPYKKIGLLRIRDTEFPKNTVRKIIRYQIDKTID